MFVSVANIYVNNRPYSASVGTPITVTDPYPTINWESRYAPLVTISNQVQTGTTHADPGGYELRIGTTSANLGSNSFSGTVVSTGFVTSDASGYRYRGVRLHRGGTYYGQLRVTDSLGNVSSWATFAFLFNRIPSITTAAISPSTPTTSDSLLLSYTFHDSDGDEDNSTIWWFRNGVHVPQFDGKISVASEFLAYGDAWIAQIYPNDGYETGPVYVTSSVSVTKAAPVASNLSIEPADPTTVDPLYAKFDLNGGSEQNSVIKWYLTNETSGTTLIEGAVTRLVRIETQAGDTVRFEVKASDGEVSGSFQASPEVTIAKPKYRVTRLTVDNENEPLSVGALTPSVAWGVTGPSTPHNKVSIKIGTAPGADNIFTTEILDGSTLFTVPEDILSVGSDYYISVAAGDDDGYGEYETCHFRTSGSLWAQTVNNATGWTVELTCKIDGVLSGSSSSSSSSTFSLDTNYQGVRIYDGTYYCEVRLYPSLIAVLPDETYEYANATLSSYSVITITGSGNVIKVFKDYNLVLSSTMTKVTTDKYIEIGAIGDSDATSGNYLNVYYTTDGAYEPSSSSQYYDMVFDEFFETRGSVDYITGESGDAYFSASDESEDESSTVYKISDYKQPVTISPSVDGVNLIVSGISSNEDGSTTYISHDKGATIISNHVIPSYDGDVRFTDGDDAEAFGWTKYSTGGSATYGVGGLTINTTDSYGKFFFTQNQPGTSWFDGVNNSEGWTVEFSAYVTTVTDDTASTDIGVPDGFGIFVSDGVYCETIYLYTQEIVFAASGVSVVQDNTTLRNYVVVGLKNGIELYAKLPSENTYRLVAQAKMSTRATMEANGGRPSVAETNGIAHAVWHDDGGGYRRLYYSNMDTSTIETGKVGKWTYPVMIVSDKFGTNSPSITVDSEDRVFVAFESLVNDSTDIGIILRNQYGWSRPYLLQSEAFDAKNPKITSDASDNIHVVWEDYRNINPQVYYTKRSSITGVWTTPVAITAEALGAVRPSIDSDGSKIYVSFTSIGTDGTTSVYVTYNNGTNWSVPLLASSTPTRADFSDILAYNGSVVVAWDDNKSEDYEIYARHYGATLSPTSAALQLTADTVASRFPRLGIHTGADSNNGDIVLAFESGGDLTPYTGTLSSTDTAIKLCYYDSSAISWVSSNQTGGYDIFIDTGDTRYSRRPAVARKFSGNADVLYETEIVSALEYSNPVDNFTSVRSAVFTMESGSAVYDASSAELDMRVSAQRPRREIRFGDFSDARNLNVTFGYFRYYIGDGVAPFSVTFISGVSECVAAMPNLYGDAWLSTNNGLKFFKRSTAEIASISSTVGTPKSVRFDNNSRMYVLNVLGTIYYSDDHYTFTTTGLGPQIVDFDFDQVGMMWVLTSSYLLRYDLSSGTPSLSEVYSLQEAIGSSVSASSIAIDGAGSIWIATNAGLVELSQGQMTSYTPLNSGIPSASVTGVAVKDNATRFVATTAGVAKMTSNTFEKIIINDPDWVDEFSAIEWMAPNVLWLAGNSKVLQVIVVDDTYELVSFGASDLTDSSGQNCFDRSKFTFEYTPVNDDALVEVIINGRVLKHGYIISDSKLKFQSALNDNDEVSLRFREDIVNFGTLSRNRAEKELFGDDFRNFKKLVVDGERVYGSVTGDVNQLSVYTAGDTSVLPYDKIVLDTTPPFGNLVFEKLTSSRRIAQLSIESYGDNLSGLDSMIVANYPNLTSDGETPLTWSPFKERFLFDLGSDLGNVTTQLSFEGASGKRISKFGTAIYAGTAGSAKIYRLNSTTLKWVDMEAFGGEEADTSVEFMIQYKEAMIVGTSSDISGGKLWKTADGSTYELLATLAASQPKCATILNGNLYVGTGGTNGGRLYRYNNVRVQSVFDSALGSEISSITWNKDFLYVGTTGEKGFVYRLTTDVSASGQTLSNAFRATALYIDSYPTISAVAAVTLKGQTTASGGTPLDDLAIFAGNGNGGRIVKSLNASAYGTSFYTLPVNIAQLKVDENTGLLHAAVGKNIYKYKNRTWQPVFTNDLDIEDVYLDQTGFYIISATGVKFFSYERANKKVYLALRDVAGNVTQVPGTAPSDDGGTEIPFIEIGIDDLTGFVNANRILELDEYGVEVFNYDGEAPYYAASKVETERAEYFSEVFNGTSDHVSWDSIYWDAIVPEGCDIKVQVRSGNTKTSVLQQPFLKKFDKEDFEGGDISSLSGQYIQFKIIMTTTLRGKTPRLYSVNIRGLSRSSVHFFTTNFTLPSRILKGILTADTFVPVAADVVFGINTNDSVDFSDYQVIEPNRVFTMNGDQIGKNLRIGVKLISPLSVVAQTDSIVEYNEYAGDVYNNVIDFNFTNNTGDTATFNFKVELYDDAQFETLSATLYTGSDSLAWGADYSAFPTAGVELEDGESAKILAAVKGNAAIRCNTTYYAKVYYGVGSTFTLISDDHLFVAGCNPTFNESISFDFMNTGTSAAFNFRARYFTDATRTKLATKADGSSATYYSGIDTTGWTVDGAIFSESGSTIAHGRTVTVRFTPETNDLEAGVYFLVVDQISGSDFEVVSNSLSVRMPTSSTFSCGEYTDVPVVKNISILFDLEDYTEKFGSRERTRRTIQLNL